MIKKVELLAPAGDMQSLVSAIKAGADAIYLGTDKFSARAKAFNFNREEVAEAIDYAHLRGVKIFITINTLLLDEELDDAFELVEYLDEIGVDGIIVQDFGFANILNQNNLSTEVHSSTQMAVNNMYGVKTLEELGFDRVVLARETSLKDMNRIKEGTNVEIEGFIHGALCVSFSGECLMSSMIGGRSGNRGDCAQACRKSYKIIDLNGKVFDEKYYISPKDLNTLSNMNELVDNGVYSLKIEGRMKNPEYVYQVVSTYRKAIEGKLQAKDRENVEQIFSRGFTKGLSFGDFANDYITVEKPSNRGRLIGKVISCSNKTAIVELIDDVQIGDGIEIFGKNKSTGFKADKNYSKGRNKMQLKSEVGVEDEIYRNFSEKLDKEIKEKLNQEVKHRDLEIYAQFKIGSVPKIKLKTQEIEMEYNSEYIIQVAQNKSVSQDKILENLSKLGGTIYNLTNIELDMDENIFVPISEINNLRRQAIEKLDKKYLIKNNKTKIKYDYFNKTQKSKRHSTLSVEVSDLEDLKKIKDFSKIRVCFPIGRFDIEGDEYVKNKNIKLSGVFKKFQSTEELENTIKILKSTDVFNEVYVNNLSQISILKDCEIDMVADIGLNVFNTLTVSELLKLGFVRVVLSPELNKTQIKKIAKRYPDEIEVLSHGLIPVMTMVHCPMSVNLGCSIDSNCKACRYSKGFYLEDARNERFLVTRDTNISEIFNSHPIMLSDKIKTFLDSGIKNYKLNLFEDICQTIELYDNILNKKNFDDSFVKNSLIEKYSNITYGHYNRGVQNG